MRIALTFLIPALFLLGCSNEASQPTELAKPVAWEDKTPEQQQKETKWWRNCYAENIKKTKDANFCNAEFEKKFGYPYKTKNK